jgi:hypothetical protein
MMHWAESTETFEQETKPHHKQICAFANVLREDGEMGQCNKARVVGHRLSAGASLYLRMLHTDLLQYYSCNVQTAPWTPELTRS